MSRVFTYCSVSTSDQTTDNQVHEIAAAGYKITPKEPSRRPYQGR